MDALPELEVRPILLNRPCVCGVSVAEVAVKPLKGSFLVGELILRQVRVWHFWHLIFDQLLSLGRQTAKRHRLFYTAILIANQLLLLLLFLSLFNPVYEAPIVQERQEDRLVMLIIVVEWLVGLQQLASLSLLQAQQVLSDLYYFQRLFSLASLLLCWLLTNVAVKDESNKFLHAPVRFKLSHVWLDGQMLAIGKL